MSKFAFASLALVLLLAPGCAEKHVHEGEPMYLKALGVDLPQCVAGAKMRWEGIHYVSVVREMPRTPYDYRVVKVYCVDGDNHYAGPEVEFDPITGEMIYEYYPQYGLPEVDGYDARLVFHRDAGHRVADAESTRMNFCGGRVFIANGLRTDYKIPCGSKID